MNDEQAPEAADQGWVPPVELDGFRVVRQLGRGGMGTVYLGHDEVLDRPVALKFVTATHLKASMRERFLNVHFHVLVPDGVFVKTRTGWQTEAAATWRSPSDGKPTVRGVERLRAWFEGYSLHAGVVIAEHDRAALDRLCRYGARPAFAHERLAWTAEGQIAYRLKRPWPDGRTHLVLPPVAFLRRLCGTIPPPRRHLVRYAGASDDVALTMHFV